MDYMLKYLQFEERIADLICLITIDNILNLMNLRQAERQRQRTIVTSEEKNFKELEIKYKSSQVEADRAQAKKEVNSLKFRHLQ